MELKCQGWNEELRAGWVSSCMGHGKGDDEQLLGSMMYGQQMCITYVNYLRGKERNLAGQCPDIGLFKRLAKGQLVSEHASQWVLFLRFRVWSSGPQFWDACSSRGRPQTGVRVYVLRCGRPPPPPHPNRKKSKKHKFSLVVPARQPHKSQ